MAKNNRRARTLTPRGGDVWVFAHPTQSRKKRGRFRRRLTRAVLRPPEPHAVTINAAGMVALWSIARIRDEVDRLAADGDARVEEQPPRPDAGRA